MNFLSVPWFDCLLGAVLILQVLLTIFREEETLHLVLTVYSVAVQIGLIVALLLIEGTLRDVLIVLMFCALVSSLGAAADNWLARRAAARQGAEEIPVDNSEKPSEEGIRA